MGKKNRHFHILRMIESGQIGSQQEFLEALKNDGIHISQSTLSKDLKELGIIKVRAKNGRFRFIQTREREAFHVEVMLKRELMDFLTDSITVGANTILKTVSGNASGLAKCLDEIGWEEVVGTIAGDDTVLVMTKTPEEANSVLVRLNEIIESR